MINQLQNIFVFLEGTTDYESNRMSEMSHMENTIDQLMGELKKLKEARGTREMGESVSETESDEIKSLTNEVSRLKNENARLMETIDSLKLQLKFFNEEEKVEHPVSFQQVIKLLFPKS